jgi:LuxR family maltose regulon positive regulatory protein
LELEQSGREENATRAVRAWLRLREGDLAGAARWADAFDQPVQDEPLLWQANPQLTKALILIARRRKADLPAAHQILDSLCAIAERTHNTRFTIQIRAMQALLLDVQRDPAAAEQALTAAVELGRPGGFVRVFVDLGPPMQALLARLAQQGVDVQHLFDAFAAEPGAHQAADSGPQASPEHVVLPAAPILANLLTVREQEVLALLREPLSNKEIARRLNVSIVTVKRHNINIYSKLGVNSRWDAVAKAAALQQGAEL